MGAWLANFMISQVSPIAFANVGWRYYVVFAIGGATNAIFIWLFFPETKGVSRAFGPRKPPLTSVSPLF